MNITGIANAQSAVPNASIEPVRFAPVQANAVVIAPPVKAEQASAPSEVAAPSDGEVKRSVKEVNDYLKTSANGIEFSQDEDTGKTLVKIVDTSTGTVIRQIPTQQLVEISKDLGKLQGLLVKDKA